MSEPINIPPTAPRVQLTNGTIVAVDFQNIETAVGSMFCPVIAEAPSPGAQFVGDYRDSGEFQENYDQYLAFADLIISTSADPAAAAAIMGEDKAAWVKHWIESTPFDQAVASLSGGALAELKARLQKDLDLVRPPGAGAGYAKDPTGLLRYWLHNKVSLQANPDGSIRVV